MHIMKRFLIIVLFVPTLSSAQNFLKNLYTKTPTQITEMTDYSTNLDSAYFTSHFGTYIRDIVSAILQRGYSVDDFASFSAAVTAAATDSSTVVVSSIVTVSSNVTVPRTVGLVFMRNGRLNVSAGVTLTVNGPILQAGRHQIFDTTGTIYLNGVDELYPEWFGARSDSTINCKTAFQKTIDAASFGATIRLAPATGQTRAGSKGYIINNTVTIQGNNTQVHIMGSGSVIHNSGTDTVFVMTGITPGSDSFKRAQNVISGIRFQKIGTNGTGVAIAVVSATEQNVRDCAFEGYNNGLALVNESSGWTEHNYFEQLRFINCDTAIVYNAKGSGTSSFRNNHFSHIAIPAMSQAVVRTSEAGQAVGIAVIGTGSGTTPQIYQNTFINVSMALADSCTGFFLNGRGNNFWAQISFESFSGDGERSRAFHFGSSASNLLFWIYADFATRADLDKVVFNESSYHPQSIYTQVIGQTNSQAHGIGTIWDDTHQLFVNSVISNNAISGFKTLVGDTQVVFEHIVTSAGVSRFRYPHEDPLEFVRVFPNDQSRLGPIRAHNIGRFASINDSSVIDVRDRNFIQLQSSDVDIDSLTNLTGGIAGQTAMILFADDSMIVDNLKGNTGRFFLLDNRDRRTPDGLRSLFYNYSDGVLGGNTWREMFTLWPMGAATWNVDQLTAGSTDSVMVGYYGAEIGDPVTVGLSSIVEANANFDLKGHVVKVDSIRVFATNRSAGTYDLASGTLRYKIVR